LFFLPTLVAVTLTEKLQLAPSASVALDRVTLPDPDPASTPSM
jgi:hypothetical protein